MTIKISVLERSGWAWPKDIPKPTWGPLGWNWLHTTAIEFPAQPSAGDRREVLRRIWDFVSRLPCAECQGHARRYLQRNPPAADDTYSLQAWAWRFHNAVNARLGKRQVSYAAYQHAYSDEICWASWNVKCHRCRL
jgi:hypothetical protein